MKFELLVPLLISTLVAILGWFAAHRFAAHRDRVNKRRDLRVQYLIEAYRRLEHSAWRDYTPDIIADLESSISDIQLFGTISQVCEARAIAEDYSKSKEPELLKLLLDLRNTLRKELKLEPLEETISHIRLKVDSKRPKKVVSFAHHAELRDRE
ncbi:MAG: hypothetical protein JSW07_09655 [bacterium]|nr:MAG: hypothetical protein JSW07_09655 [bacterium]